MLRNLDPTLLTRGYGRGLDLYDDLLLDCRLYALLHKRKSAVISLPWQVEEASKSRVDRKAADMVRAHLEAMTGLSRPGDYQPVLGFDGMCYNLLDAVLKGYSVGEIMWEADGSELVAREVRDKNPRLFSFADVGDQTRLRLLTIQDLVQGVDVPDRKFIVHQFGARYGNAYGEGLGQRLYWPVWFKKNNLAYWLSFGERFGQPIPVGEYPAGSPPQVIQKLLNSLVAIGRNAAVAYPEGQVIKFLEAARSGSIDTYEKLTAYCDQEMAICLLGESATTSIGEYGTYGASQTADSIRLEGTQTDADLLSATLQRTLVKWICEYNLPDATPPTIKRVIEKREDLDKRATRDNLIVTMSGRKLSQEYLEETYMVEFEDEPAPETPPAPAPAPDPFASLSGPVELRGPMPKQAGKKMCVAGINCGGSCINRGYKCRKKLEADAAAYAKYLLENESLKQRIAELEQQLAQTPKVKAGAVLDVPISDLNFDPTRFQYKLVHGATGSSGSLAGVRKFDKNLAGVVQVWQDPADGKTYVINGHNRATLAKNLGESDITVRYIDAKNAGEARAIGAMTNIAEGRGNALDSAKFFRDTGLTKQDLEAKGIPFAEKIATDGLALSTLEPSLFNKVVKGDIPQERAIVIGKAGLDHTDQKALVDLVDAQAKRGRKITNDVLGELADTVKSSSQKSETQFDLFGSSEVTQSLAIEKATLQAKIKERLGREKRIFGTVSKSKAAQDLTRGGNIIDRERSSNIAQEAGSALGKFDKLKNYKGPIADLLNEAAARLANGENPKKVQDDTYERLLRELPNA
jgi:hypothetical protein